MTILRSCPQGSGTVFLDVLLSTGCHQQASNFNVAALRSHHQASEAIKASGVFVSTALQKHLRNFNVAVLASCKEGSAAIRVACFCIGIGLQQQTYNFDVVPYFQQLNLKGPSLYKALLNCYRMSNEVY